GWSVPAAADDLLGATIERSLLAHYVAAFLGSTACPLPEELARPLWELTAPQAQSWRDRGYFRPPCRCRSTSPGATASCSMPATSPIPQPTESGTAQ
ncbi:MAG: hypothetical protein H7323_09480, partial [Frankiales bacterium]|nr:hypothetical protein [Frankiales bacterium]